MRLWAEWLNGLNVSMAFRVFGLFYSVFYQEILDFGLIAMHRVVKGSKIQ